MNNSTINLNLLEHSWTAKIVLKNNKIITIWHTAFPMSKKHILKILSVSSDYPKCKIK